MRKAGPFLRIEEGEDWPVLCNEDELNGVELLASGDMDDLAADGTSRSAETEVVYSRDGVSVWPARKRRIAGRLSLIRQSGVLFISWLPYSQQPGAVEPAQEPPVEAAADPVAKGQYAVHPTPLSNLKAVRKQTPKLATHSVVLVLRNGLTLPPLFFGSGGVRSLFTVLKQHAVLTRVEASPGTYLVNDTEDPLQRSLATLDLADVPLPPPGAVETKAAPPMAASIRTSQHASILAVLYITRLAYETSPTADAATEAGLAGRLRSGVQAATQFARDATASLLLPPRLGPGLPGRQQPQPAAQTETGVGCFEVLDRAEPEAMRLAEGLEQPCPPPLSQEEWFSFLDSQGRVLDDRALRARIFAGGCEPAVRPEAWPYLLGLHPPGSTAAQRRAAATQRAAEYEGIQAQWQSIGERQAARFGKWRERLSRVDKDVRRTDSGHPFFSEGARGEAAVAALRRILLSYSMYNFDLGYCQGMSDFAAPLLFVLGDEAAAFWAFAGLMERVEGNFSRDSVVMGAQLAGLSALVRLADPPLHAHLTARDCANFFFCYRWLLVHFKREFEFGQVLQLWEALWSCPLTPHLHLYMAAAVLKQHRGRILAEGMGLDQLLAFCLGLAGELDLGRTLRAAERLYHSLGPAGQAALASAGLP